MVLFHLLQQHLTLSTSNSLNQVLTIRRVEEETATLPTTLLTQHQFQIINETILESINTNRLYILSSTNTKRRSYLLVYIWTVVDELTIIEWTILTTYLYSILTMIVSLLYDMILVTLYYTKRFRYSLY